MNVTEGGDVLNEIVERFDELDMMIAEMKVVYESATNTENIQVIETSQQVTQSDGLELEVEDEIATNTENIQVIGTSQQVTELDGLDLVLEGLKNQPYVAERRIKYIHKDLVTPGKAHESNTQQINIEQAVSFITLISDEEESNDVWFYTKM